jgi:hypothetical protein
MTKYNKAIITKSDSGNVTRFDFSKTDKQEIISSEDSRILKLEIARWNKQIKTLKEQIKITEIFFSQKIKSFEDISSIDTNIQYFHALDILPKTPLKEVNHLSIIPEPTIEQLQVTRERLAFRKFLPTPNDTKAWELLEKTEQPLYAQDDLNKITHEETLEEHYKLEKFKINQEVRNKYENDYVQNLSNQQLENHYQNLINYFKKELEYANEVVTVLSQIIKRSGLGHLQTPGNILPKVTQGTKKDVSLFNLYKAKRNDIEDLKILLKNLAPEIYDKINHSGKSLENYIIENSQEIISYIEGAKLTVLEDRIFCSIRAWAVNAYQQDIVDSPDRKVTVKQADIYKLCGVPYKQKGYDSKQKLAIKAALNHEGNLLKRIHIEYPQKHKDGNAILSTSFIKYLSWNDERDEVTCEVDSIFFVDKNAKFWTDDIEGRNRFMSNFEKGHKNEGAYWLHKYLACALRKKNETMEYNVTTLLKACGLINDFNNGNKKRALNKLQKYLETMYEVGTLIKNKPVRVNSNSDEHGKYLLERLCTKN